MCGYETDSDAQAHLVPISSPLPIPAIPRSAGKSGKQRRHTPAVPVSLPLVHSVSCDEIVHLCQHNDRAEQEASA
jgi:hypothetical protein